MQGGTAGGDNVENYQNIPDYEGRTLGKIAVVSPGDWAGRRSAQPRQAGLLAGAQQIEEPAARTAQSAAGERRPGREVVGVSSAKTFRQATRGACSLHGSRRRPRATPTRGKDRVEEALMHPSPTA